jgi:hypothetical protein
MGRIRAVSPHGVEYPVNFLAYATQSLILPRLVDILIVLS